MCLKLHCVRTCRGNGVDIRMSSAALCNAIVMGKLPPLVAPPPFGRNRFPSVIVSCSRNAFVSRIEWTHFVPRTRSVSMRFVEGYLTARRGPSLGPSSSPRKRFVLHR